ncbi:MAG: pyridoxal-dependent decarboxylase [Acidobacteriota bacterium]
MKLDDPSACDLKTICDLATELLAHEERSPVRPYLEPDELADRLDLALGPEGQALEPLLATLRQLWDATPRISSRRFFNQLFGGRDPVATLAEVLVVLANTPMHTFKAAGAQVLVEQEVLQHMAGFVGYDDGEGMFTAGGSLSNLAGMILARNEALPGVRDDGLTAHPERLCVYTSAEGHFSIARALGMTGLGRHNARSVPIDGAGRMRAGALRQLIDRDLRQGHRPMMINATVATTVLGAFDPLRELAEVAAEHGLWLHVDGAYGGSVLLSDRHRHLLDGCELADSFSWDAHKALGVPLSCSVLLVRRRGLLRKHFGEEAGYLFQTHDDHNPAQRSMQCARRNDALKLWTAWKHHGDAGYAQRIDRLFALAQLGAERVRADPELRLCQPPASFNVCFEVAGCCSVEICERLERESRLVVSHVEVDGQRWIRLVCIHQDLTEADLDVFFDEVKTVARAIRAERGMASEAAPELPIDTSIDEPVDEPLGVPSA